MTKIICGIAALQSTINLNLTIGSRNPGQPRLSAPCRGIAYCGIGACADAGERLLGAMRLGRCAYSGSRGSNLIKEATASWHLGRAWLSMI